LYAKEIFMTRFIIIRHATNDLKEEGVLAGRTPGVHLNAEGRVQAEALAERLSTTTLTAVYTSPLERTVETAQIVARPHDLEVQIHQGLGEVDFGRWQGESFEKLRRRRLWRKVQFVPSTMRFPGGESVREMQSRVVATWEALRADHPKDTIAIVSHADVIKAAIAYYVGLPLDLFQRLVVDAASLSILEVGKLAPYLIRLNDTSHVPHTEEEENGESN
jgi:probable phosphoglycerate mutase